VTSFMDDLCTLLKQGKCAVFRYRPFDVSNTKI
jgi:hypothetical protein